VQIARRYQCPPAVILAYGNGPGCPRRKRLWLEGERKLNGLADIPADFGFKKTDKTKSEILATIMVLTILSAAKKDRLKGIFFTHEPGLDIPQCGQVGSSTLISLLQLGQRSDVRFVVAIVNVNHQP